MCSTDKEIEVLTYGDIEAKLKQFDEYKDFSRLTQKQQDCFIWMAGRHIVPDSWKVAMEEFTVLTKE